MKRNHLAILITVTLVGGLAPLIPALQALEEASVDARFHVRGSLPNTGRVVVVGIDDTTEQKWRTIPKALWGGELAKVVRKINQAGASRLAIDFIVGVDADIYLASLGVRATPNQDLDVALSELGNRVILGTFTGQDIVPLLRETSDGRTLVSVNTLQTVGGVIRQVPRVDRYLFPPLPGLASSLSQAQWGEDRPLQINYSGSTTRVISALDLLENRVPTDELKGALVLLGETNKLSQDHQDTPFGRVPGVMIQAEATRTLVENRELKQTPIGIKILLGALLSGIFGFFAIRYTSGKYLLGTLLFVAVWSVLVIVLFSNQDIVLPWFLPTSIALIWTPLFILPLKTAEEHRERLWARAQWGQMVSDEFVAVLENKRSSGMGAMETFNAALVFLDIEDFSARSNALPPEALLEGLNTIFGYAIAEVQTQGGTVLNFMGDGLSAMFIQKPGDPPSMACDAALTCSLRLVQAPGWKVRLGLSFGEVTLALVGSRTRKQMTVYGPAVNMASRLEQAGKDLHSPLVISADYREAISLANLPLTECLYHPKGWSQPVPVFYLPHSV